VLHTRPDVFAGSRELLQLGAELFGHPGPESDIEVIRLMLATLSAAGVRAPHVDLGHVGVFRGLAASAKLPAAIESDLFEALQRKARQTVEQLLTGVDAPAATKSMLGALLELSGGPDTLARARAALTAAPVAVQESLANLESVAAALTRDGQTVNFDLTELRGYRYYTGVVFSAYVAGQGQAIAKGGRYDGIGAAFGRARAATGFSTDLRRLLSLTAENAASASAILAPADASAELVQAIARLRAGGERVVQNLPGAVATARELGCDRQLVLEKNQWTVKPV
jgi:ATP phosphoribosyltransferase regulatory subunit